MAKEAFMVSSLKFSVYRIGPDEYIKNTLIENINYLYDQFDEICYYLSKHFIKDPLVKEFVYDILKRKDIPYNYIIAIIFKYFSEIIDFDEDIYSKYYKGQKNKDWYIRYFMLDWIYLKNPDILSLIDKDDNNIVSRKLYYYKYIYIKGEKARKLLIKELIKEKNTEIALLGHSLSMNDFIELNIDKNDIEINEFIKRIHDIPSTEIYINITLERIYNIANGHYFFNYDYWDEEELAYIDTIFKKANNVLESDTSIWLNYINTFNHLITVKLLEIL